MRDLIIHTSDSDAGDQSRCDLNASVNDALVNVVSASEQEALVNDK